MNKRNESELERACTFEQFIKVYIAIGVSHRLAHGENAHAVTVEAKPLILSFALMIP